MKLLTVLLLLAGSLAQADASIPGGITFVTCKGTMESGHAYKLELIGTGIFHDDMYVQTSTGKLMQVVRSTNSWLTNEYTTGYVDKATNGQQVKIKYGNKKLLTGSDAVVLENAEGIEFRVNDPLVCKQTN